MDGYWKGFRFCFVDKFNKFINGESNYLFFWIGSDFYFIYNGLNGVKGCFGGDRGGNVLFFFFCS